LVEYLTLTFLIWTRYSIFFIFDSVVLFCCTWIASE
jgi:hypothetical protein